jgi:hypothetical protein
MSRCPIARLIIFSNTIFRCSSTMYVKTVQKRLCRTMIRCSIDYHHLQLLCVHMFQYHVRSLKIYPGVHEQALSMFRMFQYHYFLEWCAASIKLRWFIVCSNASSGSVVLELGSHVPVLSSHVLKLRPAVRGLLLYFISMFRCSRTSLVRFTMCRYSIIMFRYGNYIKVFQNQA